MRCLKDEFKTGNVFHIYNRTIKEQLLFYDHEDYDFFTSILENNLESIPTGTIAYCLMPNHFHFLLRQESDLEIYKLINYTLVSYVQIFNKKYERAGHLFRGHLQHKKITSPNYLLQLCKYIHMNPVRAGLVESPEEWPYSNYLEWIGQRESKLYSKEIIKDQIPNIERYIKYINSYHNYLWDEEFREMLLEKS